MESSGVAAVVFDGDASAFRRLAWRGNLLQIPTLGLYRFWYTTDLRRHFWSSTRLGADRLEYTGTARELLLGFLFALAILVPVYLVLFLISTEMERVQAFSGVATLVFLFLFGQFASYKARRYRLSRTLFRGLRFSMQGSAVAYAVKAGLWTLAALFTLGLAYPWRQAALERAKMQDAAFGDLQGRFEGSGWDFFKQGIWMWAVLVLGLAAATGVGAASRPEVGGVIAIAIGVAVPFLYAVFRAVETRWALSGVRFGPVRFESDLDKSFLIGIYARFIGVLMLVGFASSTILALVGIASGGFERMTAAGGIDGSTTFIAAVIVVYIAAIVVAGVAADVLLRRRVWIRVAQSLTVVGIDAIDGAQARAVAAPSGTGEGLADALDVGGF